MYHFIIQTGTIRKYIFKIRLFLFNNEFKHYIIRFLNPNISPNEMRFKQAKATRHWQITIKFSFVHSVFFFHFETSHSGKQGKYQFRLIQYIDGNINSGRF